MSAWEERMSQRAKAREAAAEARKKAAAAARLAGIAAELPALPGERRIDWSDEHFGHLTHLCFNTVLCSCGESMGVCSVALTDDYVYEPCEICKVRKIGAFGVPDPAPGVFEIVAGVLAQPLRDALERHLDEHGCATPGHPNFTGGFGHCDEARSLFALLPVHEQIIVG